MFTSQPLPRHASGVRLFFCSLHFSLPRVPLSSVPNHVLHALSRLSLCALPSAGKAELLRLFDPCECDGAGGSSGFRLCVSDVEWTSCSHEINFHRLWRGSLPVLGSDGNKCEATCGIVRVSEDHPCPNGTAIVVLITIVVISVRTYLVRCLPFYEKQALDGLRGTLC